MTAIGRFGGGADASTTEITAGQIGKLWGLSDVRMGDAIGRSHTSGEQHYFAPPTLEAVVVPSRSAEKTALHAALSQLAEQDPLINLRQDDIRQELHISLYGEVQKEVIEATLADDYGIGVSFRESASGNQPCCVRTSGRRG